MDSNINNSRDIPYLKVAGSYKEIGKIHGDVFANRISSLYQDRLNILLNANPNISLTSIKQISEKLWKATENFDECIAEEVSATAEACGLDPWQMIIAGGYSDVLDLINPKIGGLYHECTVAINPIKGFIAGTWDSHPSAINSLILLERHPINAPSTLALTTCGWPCQQGINSNGVGFAITNLTPSRVNNLGLIYISANAVIGMEGSVSSVINRFEATGFCSGHSYVVLDSSQGAIIETTSENIFVRKVNDIQTKTNHYWQGKGAIDTNSRYQFLKGSKNRQDELFTNIIEVSYPEDFSKCLSNSSLVNRKNMDEVAVTCAHFFISVNNKTLWYAKGPAFSETGANQMLSKELL